MPYANERDEDGNYFFAGTATATKPFINTQIVDFGALSANQTLSIAGITITAGGSEQRLLRSLQPSKALPEARLAILQAATSLVRQEP